MIRLYFNRRCAQPWSLDNGPGTPELTCAHVIVSAPGLTMYDASQTDPDQACAWVEFEGAKLERLGDETYKIVRAK